MCYMELDPNIYHYTNRTNHYQLILIILVPKITSQKFLSFLLNKLMDMQEYYMGRKTTWKVIFKSLKNKRIIVSLTAYIHVFQ